MGTEAVTHINDLNPLWPLAADPKSAGDDHMRNLKTALLNDLNGFTGSIMCTGTDGGVANAYTVTPGVNLVAYGLRMTVVFSPTVANTGACTLNISSLGAKPLRAVNGADLVAGDLAVGTVYAAFYNGTEFRLSSVTKNYLDQLVFAPVLPAQAGNADKLITTNGTAASWTDRLNASVLRWKDGTDATKLLALDLSAISTGTTRTLTAPNKSGTIATLGDLGLVLLATITPTAAATIDALSVFSAAYDNYMIVGSGVNIGANVSDSISLRLANAGTVDSATNYYQIAPNGTSTSAVARFLAAQAGPNTGNNGFNFAVTLLNMNDATNTKGFRTSAQHATLTGGYQLHDAGGVYVGGACSGFRLYWSGGSSFAAVGKVRIYGFNN